MLPNSFLRPLVALSRRNSQHFPDQLCQAPSFPSASAPSRPVERAQPLLCRACQDCFAGAVHLVPSFPMSGGLLCYLCCHHGRQLPLLHTLPLFGGFHSPPLHSCSSPSSCSKPGGTTGWQSQRQQLWALPSPCSEMEHPQPGSVTPRRDKDGTGVLNCLSAGCEASKRESMINSPRESEAQRAG